MLSRTKQAIFVVAGALGIIALSAATTLYITGYFSGSDTATAEGYKNITFTDAFIECETYTRDRYAGRLKRLTLDSHSSRYDEGERRYKIFLQLDMYKPDNYTDPVPYWVNCFVTAAKGDIAHYEIYQAENAPVKPVTREDSGTFGWP